MYRCAAGQFQQDATVRVALSGSAVLSLVLGICVYLLDRDWASTLFLSSWAQSQGEQVSLFGPLGLVLPSFFHAYAFALLLIMTLGRSRRARLLGAGAWFVVAAGLEILQVANANPLLPETATPPVESTLFSSIQSYVTSGHFDPGDLCAAAIGCLAAYIVSSILEVER